MALEQHRRKKARELLGRSGYKAGGHFPRHDDAAADAKMIGEAIREHEAHDHPGEPHTKLHFRDGGAVDGLAAGGRADRPKRGGHKGKGKTSVNVIVAPQGGAPRPVPVPVPAAGAAPPRPMPSPAPTPVPAGAGPALAVPGAPRPPAPGMGPMRRGGKVEAGAGSGVGRLQHADEEAERPGGKRKKGGCC